MMTALYRSTRRSTLRRLKTVQEATRISSMRCPAKEYFESTATVPAFLHRTVMQVLIFLVADILEAEQLEALRAYLDWYSCCNSPLHTEGSLRELEQKARSPAGPQHGAWRDFLNPPLPHELPPAHRSVSSPHPAANTPRHIPLQSRSAPWKERCLLQSSPVAQATSSTMQP
ncbi:unnamed protein product [Closterium sp. Yama58-4]|nr:unnamed protein product [Closterium sp. Yama58-4]